MKQVVQNFKTGNLSVEDVLAPALSKSMVLVENKYSLISSGTERSTVKVAKASLLGKAKQRPDLVAQVLQNIKKEGLKATLDKVRTKLDSLKALGYSTAGEVLASMDTNQFFKPGDRVACAGQDYASHAEVIAVPQNLVVKIPDNVTDDEASFTTLGAIAMQGVRQANPKLGEIVAVIGLGLLGQLTCQLLKANGCKVMGIDISEALVQLAKNNSADEAMNRNDAGLVNALNNFTNGHGFDSVIITAAAASNDPIELSAEILRRKGKVIAVGAVKLDVPRDPHFYRKELDLRLSCSYGPGRYDVIYEEQGQDYPYAYVRWTEQRNMEAFLQLLSQKKIQVSQLVTHRFAITEAEQAYKIVMGEVQEPHMAILLHYPKREDKLTTSIQYRHESLKEINAAFIGAGSFAQSYLIPHVKTAGSLLHTVVTSKGITAKSVAEKFGFNKASSLAAEVFAEKNVNTIFIATPHDSHATLTLQALKANKNVFVEKPLAINEEELDQIRDWMEKNGGNLQVGFNRRFSPAAIELKNHFRSAGPLVIHYRVNAGFIAKEHWIQQENIGGGRILGEVCHFIDLMQFVTGADPVSVFAESIHSVNEKIINDDNVCIIIRFADGSTGNIIYTANGDKALAKERVEIFGGSKSGVLNDFKTVELYSGNKLKQQKLEGKGHKQEIEAFIGALKNNQPMPIDFRSIYLTTQTTFRILDSLRTGLPQKIS